MPRRISCKKPLFPPRGGIPDTFGLIGNAERLSSVCRTEGGVIVPIDRFPWIAILDQAPGDYLGNVHDLPRLRHAADNNTKLVSIVWLQKCVTKRQLVPLKRFLIKLPPWPGS